MGTLSIRTSLVLLFGLGHCLSGGFALTGGWVETDPTWVTPDEWEDDKGVRHVAGYVLDSNLRTGWQRAAEEVSWILTFDLQTPITLSRVHLWYYHAREVEISRSVLGQRFESVKPFPAKDFRNGTEVETGGEIRLHEVDLSGFLATGRFWRLELTSSVAMPMAMEIMEVKFFQACSGFERTVCMDGDCDVHEVICDGIVDCDDGSDEMKCDEEICSNGAAINKTQLCDDRDDCGDGTDEQNCCERQGKMACSNGQCTDLLKECNGTESLVPCGDFIQRYSRCDGIEDCSDGSDESCPAVTCDNGALFHPATRCNGRDDCGDNSDEKNCECYYLHDKGTSYRGLANRDGSCQFWTSQYPHTHNYTPDAYPSAGLEQNYCRNPDGKDRPWCYTNNPLIRWMYCDDVFACDAVPTRCFYTIDKGRSYAGHMNRAGDRVCQRWDSQSPHSHPHTPQAHPDAGLEENFCRNPDNKERPWCYTTDPTLRWDYCNVMECADPTSLSFIGQECEEEYICGDLDWARQQGTFCFCDNDCRFFGDCCEDYEEDSLEHWLPDHHRLKWKCVSGFFVKWPSYWLVADCPDEWEDDFTRDQCLKQVDPFNPSDTVYRSPVEVDYSHRTYYRNIFCAMCNNVAMTELSSTQVRPMCSGQLNSSAQIPTQEYSNVLRTLGVVEDVEVGGCLGINKLAFKLQDGRRCISAKADFSHANCDVAACMSYSYPVFGRYKTYRNLHCALCEGLSLTATTNLRCGAAVGFGRARFGDLHGSCVGYDCLFETSLTRLFNFDVDESGGNNPNQCPLDTVYDPFVDTCRHFSSISNSQDSSNQTIPSQNCSKPALTFTSDEFSVLPNGSVHLLSSNMSCPAEQVVILNTTASICGECILQLFSNDTRSSRDPDQGRLTLGLIVVSIVAVFGFVFHTVRSGRWEKVPEKLKCQMMICMVTAEAMFVSRVIVPSGPGCTAFVILLHYLLLTAFTSMNALSIDLFLTFHDGLERVEMYKYLLYTWLVPVLVVVPTIIVEFGSSVRVGYGESCWIGNPTASLVAFGVPVLCSLLVNAVLVTFVLLAIRKSFQIADAANSRSQSSKAWVYLRISFLTGFTWILGFIYPYVNSSVVEYIFIVLNASQGLLLSVALTMTSKVIQKWKSAIRARFGLGEPHRDNGATATSSNRRTIGGKTEVTTAKTGPSTDIEMTTFADVEENRARPQLDGGHQSSGCTATASSRQSTAGETEPTTGGSNPATLPEIDVKKNTPDGDENYTCF
ncbi:uncharacterized protein [Branchiostoma lanceolatum]|uniref:uncharacterized protein n=1 Tax=Branchiostoma lanceolatum TaxID=7740 RepID=UPI003451B665